MIKLKNRDKLKGRIFKIESLNTHNGPGYRTVIYFKGCPLSCLWCHNPEGISRIKEIWVIHAKCICCQTCVNACPSSALSMEHGRIEIDRNKCIGCHTCANVCPSGAIEKLGEDYSVSELFEKILKDKPFIEASGGGVTVTGGEPGIHPEFVASLFKKCREAGIHTAFDTSGFISEKSLEMIIPYSDLVFFDLKIIDETKAIELTGQGTAKIIESLNWIKSYIVENGIPELHFRTPVIPAATDSDENLNAIVQLIQEKYNTIWKEWELNLFNDVCEDKYHKLNKNWIFGGSRMGNIDYQRIEEFSKKNQEFNITISGYVSK